LYFGERCFNFIAKFVRIWVLFEQESIHSSDTRMSREGSEGCEMNSVQQSLSPTHETLIRQQHVRHGAKFINLFLTHINVAYCTIFI
jgi:hypothetical protein